MNEQEKKLFFALCSFQSETLEEDLLQAATPEVLGQLFFNRMQAVAYGTLKEKGMLGKVNREFRNSLKGAYERNQAKNESFFRCIRDLSEILSDTACPYAMLKGAYLCRYYPEAYRTSNDIDLLVLPDDVTAIGNALIQAGFRQGNIRNSHFEPATRREIIESKMTRGETVPYLKEVNLPGMQFLEVDLNFSLDYKPGNADFLKQMLSRAGARSINGLEVRTLDSADFFIHLCCHLYKEATTLPWVEMMRDMTLYKYCDIYALLGKMEKEETVSLFRRAYSTGTEKICAFAVRQTSELFDLKNQFARTLADTILRFDPDLIHRVLSPADNKTYRFREKDLPRRLFAKNRKNLLEEICNEKA